MKFFDRLFRGSEARARGSVNAAVFGLAGGYGDYTPRQAENLAAVTACVNVVSSALGSLPARVYRQEEAGRSEAPTHPVARLIRTPNRWQTWPDMIEWVAASVLLAGNALLAIEHDGAGRPTALLPIPWHCVQPMLLPSGSLAFDVVAFTAPWNATGLPRRLLASEVFHLKDRSDDGLIGRSRLSRAPSALGTAIALQTYTENMWLNGATPAGAIKLASKLDEPAHKRLRAAFEQRHTGPENARRILILEHGAEWQSLSISPEDAELLESRRFTVEELCRLFQVPPPLVQDYSRNTFTNAATAGLWFAQFSLSPWVRKIEAEFSRSVFGPSSAGFELNIDLSGLTRGDFTARWASYATAVDKDILTTDEIREAEGYNPRSNAAASGVAT